MKFCLFLPVVFAFDFNTISSVQKAIAGQLLTYYPPNPSGAVPENGASDASGVQWYESGILWGAVTEYTRLSGDSAYVGTFSTALGQASFDSVASFLDGSAGSAISALLATTGAEIFGSNAVMPNNVKFIDVSINTFNEAFAQWDTQCGGGIYWSRDRNSANAAQAAYKSSITNSEFILVAARLYILTGNQTYLNAANQVYDWMKATVVTPTGTVYDGINAIGCVISASQYSYESGTLIGALAWMYSATKDDKYLADANIMATASLAQFTTNGIFTDPCEPSCDVNKAQYKGVTIRGMMYLWNVTKDANVKSAIQKAVDASMTAMATTCDAQWNCQTVWNGAVSTPSNFHTQLNALELANAAMLIHSTGDVKPAVAPSVTVAPPNKNDGNGLEVSVVNQYALLAFLTLYHLF